ncbi:MAG: UDP-3-O-[3-hydroxymyristoyl] N-acetylglucosamine deacetylase [Hyphomicrobiales bacterium]|nr:UDP-3-O-[3-hydroxymyristoyl] N-acetylglucosamine deacetylase [Hyphomicrobiales bacterium]
MTAHPQPRQTTLARAATLGGIGVHSGAPAQLTLHPAPAGEGLCFVDSCGRTIPALWRHGERVALRTQLRRGAARLSTVEHVLAALAGLGVDNALIEIEGAEAPALDGSAAPIGRAILDAGITTLAAPRRRIEILKTVRAETAEGFAELSPGAGLSLDVAIDFAHPAIGAQRIVWRPDPGTFMRDIAPARSFGFLADVEALWRTGLARGAGLDNTLAFDARGPVNPEGVRFPDECVRHKALDALGDLALAGAPIEGTFRSLRGGHALNLAVLQALFADSSAWRWSWGRAAAAPETRVAL